MTIKQAIKYAQKLNIDFMSSRKILCNLLKVNEQYIIIHSEQELEENIFQKFKNNIQELKEGKPLQYITNKREFMGYEFYVDEKVLIPQPDTEVLVEQTIIKIQDLLKEKSKICILDLCTGSGAIAISLKKLFPKNIEMYASDISEEALEIAKKNTRNILEDFNEKESEKIKFIQSDMFNNINTKFDIIVSNPPYIKTDVIHTLGKDVQSEPQIALDGGEDGLKFYKIIKENMEQYLNKNGYILLEIGYDQKEEVTKLFENAECIQDYAGNDRVIIWKKRGENERIFY